MQDNELLQAISDMMDKKLDERFSPINTRLDNVDSQITTINTRLGWKVISFSLIPLPQNHLANSLPPSHIPYAVHNLYMRHTPHHICLLFQQNALRLSMYLVTHNSNLLQRYMVHIP